MKRRTDISKQRAGRFLQQSAGYAAFIPAPLPPQPPLNMDEALQSKLALAERQLGRLDSVSTLVPDPDRFVYMYVRQEAVLSSQIEGTQASLSDLLAFEAGQGAGEVTVDIAETLNYMRALDGGIKLLRELPICTRLFCQVHQILLTGVRGGESSRTPGALRRTQNWIGGNSLSSAIFIPPPPAEMQTAMGELEKYLNDATKLTPLLVEIGLAHAQFETIHPFLDGNGRIGRLMITFLLAARGVLKKPLLYLSHYFKRHRDEYYALLQAIRTDGAWEQWLAFFLDGVAEVAEEATARAHRIVQLCGRDQETIRRSLGARAGTALQLLDIMMRQPILATVSAAKLLKRSQPTVDRLLADLARLKLLREITGQRWGRKFAYKAYLGLFES